MAKKSKVKVKKIGTRRPKGSVYETATKATLLSLQEKYNIAKTRVGNTNAGFAQVLKEAAEFKNLNPVAFKLAMRFMAFDPLKARRNYDDLQGYLDHLGFHNRKAADLFKDHAPKAKKTVTTARGSGGLVPIGDGIAKAVENAKAKPEENNVTPLRQAAE